MGVQVEAVEVHPDEHGGLLVRWTLVGGDGAVDLAVGPTPEHVDHAHVMHADPTEREVVLGDLGPGRHYVSVAPHAGGSAVVAAERRVPFEGVRNFRDLGGYPSELGGRTRWGLVFRSDALWQLTVTDLDAYEQLGLRAVYDLRGDRERDRDPNPMDSHHVPLAQPHNGGFDFATLQTRADAEQLLATGAIAMLDAVGPSLGGIIAGLTDPGGLPAVFHCAGGKDRTGLTAALLLRALGVDRETVLDDYELTTRWRRPEHETELIAQLTGLGVTADALDGFLGAPRWVMAAALDHVDRELGGVEAYLLGPAAVEPEILTQLRQRLLD